MQKLLEGKNVLITGAGRNIGRSIALEMAREGANVFFTDVEEERRRQVEADLLVYGGRSKGFISDVSTVSDTDKLLRRLSADKFQVDVLVNNVGVRIAPKIEERSLFTKALGRINSTKKAHNNLQMWRDVYETNVFGPLYLTNKIAEGMIRDDILGSIIFITSIHQWLTLGDPAYSSSKAALGMIVNELSFRLNSHRIRVNGIAPGFVYARELLDPAGLRHRWAINPDHVGRTAVYLAADYFSQYTTGTVIKIDAGLSLHNASVELFGGE